MLTECTVDVRGLYWRHFDPTVAHLDGPQMRCELCKMSPFL